MKSRLPGSPIRVKVASPKPLQVLRPQTVITMRQMMERVVAWGTGKKAHVLGYTTGGKTGTAQIFDFAHHVYTHQL